MKIYTHNGDAHFDDVVAVGLLLQKFPHATVVRTPQVPQEVEPEDIVVDTGGKYDGCRFFDHHMGTNVPASFVLVLRDVFGIDIHSSPDLFRDFIYCDVADRMGPQKANEMLGVKVDFQHPLVSIITSVISKEKEILPESCPHQLLVEIGRKTLEIVQGRIELRNYIKSLPVENGVVISLDRPVSPVIVKQILPETIGIVCRNPQRGDCLSVISIDNNPHFRPEKIPAEKRVFLHATKFLAVVPETVLVEEIIQQCIS